MKPKEPWPSGYSGRVRSEFYPSSLTNALSPRAFSNKERSENRLISNYQDNQIEKKYIQLTLAVLPGPITGIM